jgi:CBS domain containing-hemolysin-like protein
VLLLSPPLVLVSRIFRPLIWALNALTNALVRLVGVEPKDEASSAFTLDEVAGIVEQSTREGVLSDRSGTLSNAFEFTEAKVGDVEVPVDQLVCLPPGATPADVHQAVQAGGFSRYPIQDEAGRPVGYVHLKDVLDLVDGPDYGRPIPRPRIRHLRAVLHTADLEDALAGMRRDGLHLVRSVDERGETTGVLFLEDVIEVLVGEVEDATSVD